MKFPKHRAHLYLVERIDPDATSVVCGGFDNLAAAEDFSAACEQEWVDRYPDWNRQPMFRVALTTYYDA